MQIDNAPFPFNRNHDGGSHVSATGNCRERQTKVQITVEEVDVI